MKRRCVPAIVICIAGAPLLASCNPSHSDTRIVAKLLAPGGGAQAVYADDMGGGATVGPFANVYVVTPGHFPRLADRVFSAGRVCNVQTRWIDDRTLEIDYSAIRELSPQVIGQRPTTWWAPWLWGDSPSSTVSVRFQWKGGDPASGC